MAILRFLNLSMSMTLFQAIVIGIVQGLTEFLPISSTAHMRIVPALLGWPDPGSAFSAVIQIGTLMAVLAYFWRDLWRIFAAMLTELSKGVIARSQDSRLGWMISVGTIPIVVAGLAFEKQIDSTLRSMYVISTSLIVVALLLAVAEWLIRKGRLAGRDMEQITWRDALLVGCTQAVALVPGTSRSGMTILGGLISGLNREAAARYSFLLSVPAVFAAGVYKLIKESDKLLGNESQMLNLAAGLIAAAVVGYLSIDWLLRYLRSRTTFVFIVYRIGLAVVLLILLQANVIKPMPESPESDGQTASSSAHFSATNR